MVFRLLLRTDAVYTHLMYIPIALACTWWGLRGMWVALILGAAVVVLHFLGGGASMLGDAARVAFFGVVAFLVGTLKEQERTGREAHRSAETRRQELAELARRQEEQLEHSTRLAELGEMAAAISHELNQPLTGIRNYARNAYYMLDNSVGSTEEVQGNLRLIAEQVDRAAKIINQMRELTRRAERSLLPVDVNGVLRETVEFLMPQMRLSEIEVHLSLDDHLPQTRGDHVRLAQVFLNLLANARQAMEASLQRSLSLRSGVDAEGQIVIEVSDTGKGFGPEEAKKLFMPFYTTKQSGHGTGLGLSISKSIIKDHGGSIEAAGRPGQGATFTVRLPVRAAQEEARGG
jgi:two-component system C4-dicarboxylate transport sensor histidine kinase DctB